LVHLIRACFSCVGRRLDRVQCLPVDPAGQGQARRRWPGVHHQVGGHVHCPLPPKPSVVSCERGYCVPYKLVCQALLVVGNAAPKATKRKKVARKFCTQPTSSRRERETAVVGDARGGTPYKKRRQSVKGARSREEARRPLRPKSGWAYRTSPWTPPSPPR